IGQGDIQLIIRLRTDGLIPDHPAVIEIGAQQLANSFLEAPADIAALGRLFGVTEPFLRAAPRTAHYTSGGVELLAAAAPWARDFWRWLGCRYAAIDIDGSDGSIALDLNYDDVPASELGRYHLVTNFGTTEHVANQLNAFKVIHDLAAPGGLMIHHLPAHGMLDHGLVNYNPKFFWHLARSNRYRLCYMDYRMGTTHYRLPQSIADPI